MKKLYSRPERGGIFSYFAAEKSEDMNGIHERMGFLFMKATQKSISYILLLAFSLLMNRAAAQYSLTGSTYSQNFDNLGNSNNTVTGGNLDLVNTSLNGWYFSESGTNANTTITVDNGSTTTGDTYNYGATSGTDRALGGLQSGSNNPTFGFYFINQTGSTITSLTITYTGETWRNGNTGRTDEIDFAYSYDATSLSTGTWTLASSLNYTNPAPASVAAGVSAPLNSSSVSATITGLSIADNSTFFIRWTDFNATGADDGLGIDDFSFTTTVSTSPLMTITTSHPAAANLSATSTSNVIAIYKLAATNNTISISSASFVTAGTYTISTDISNFKCWQNNSASLSGATLIGTNTVIASGGTFTFNSGFTDITAGNSSYLIITVDVASSPSLSNVRIAADPVSNFSFTSPGGAVTVNPSSGSLTQGNLFTIAAQFQAGKLAILRNGDGSSALTGTVQVDILQFNTSGTSQNGFVAAQLPTTTTSGGNNRLVQNGASTSEGELTLSADGKYLTVVGYDAAPVSSSVASSTTVATVIGRIDLTGSVNTTTVLARSSSFSGSNIRSGTTTDGTNFWLAGTSSGSTGGVRYTTLGSTSASSVAASPDNTRIVNIYKNSSNNNQVYVSTASGTSFRIASVGTGTPTSTGQTLTNLPGFLSSTGDPYGYILLDADASISGPDLLYAASLNTSPSGLLKYYYDAASSSWVSAGSLTGNIRGVTATLNCSGTVDLYVTWSSTGTSRPSRVYKFNDAAGRTSNITSSGSALTSVSTQLNASTSPGSNYNFAGGIAFTPLPDITISSSQSLTAGTYRNITITSGTLTLSGDVTILGDVSIASGSTLDCGVYHLFNTTDFRSTFTLNSGATLKTADAYGITASSSSGAVQTCSRSYSSGANYVYAGTAAQVTGDGLPSTMTGSLTINNTGAVGDNTVTLTSSAMTIASLTLTAGYLSVGSANTLTISGGGTVTGNGGDFASGTAAGTLSFPGTGTFTTSSPLNPYNVYISGGVNFGTSTNINGTLRINSGGFVNTNAPSYATNATLQYYSGSVYGRSTEWSATSGAGYPYNVQVSNNTTLNYPNGTVVARAMEGSLTIDAGSSLYMDYSSPGNSQPLTVTGNITINGNFSLGDAGGGDLYLGRNWTRGSSGVFTPNSRIVYFGGGGTQTITVTGGGTETFNYLGISKPANNVKLSNSPATNVIVNGSSGDVLQLLNTAGGIDLNAQTMTLSGVGGNILTTNASHTITGSSGSTFTVSGTKTVTTSVSAGTLIFDSNVLLTSTTGIDFGSGLTTINGTFRIDAGGFVTNNAPSYGTGSLLKYNSGTTYNRTLEWSASSGAGYPYNVQISNSTSLVPGGSSNTAIALNASNNVTIDALSSLYMDYSTNDMTVPLTVGNDITINGNLSASDISGGDIIVKGSWYNNTGAVFSPKSRAVYFSGTAAQSITGTQSTTFDYLINSNTSADATMNKDVTANQKITLQTGSVLAINGNTLTINSTVDNSTGNLGSFRGSSSSNLTMSGTGQVGTLRFVSGGQTLNTLSLNRTGISSNYAALLGSDLTVNGLTLTNGILATGSNLLTWTKTGSLLPAAQTSYTANSASYKSSYICICDGTGTELSFVEPYDGSKGFRINSVGTDVWFPIGVDFTAPNRMWINNTGTSDNITVAIQKGDIYNTDFPVVQRIWFVKENTTGGAAADMRLYFTKQDNTQFGISQDEVENGFDYTATRLAQRNYSDDNYLDISQGADIQNVLANTNGTEVYAKYSIGVSPDVSNNTDGINYFSRFMVLNDDLFILPVTITNFRAWQDGDKARLSWISNNETNIESYIIERSADNRSYAPIGTVNAIGSGALSIPYAYIDALPLSGKNYYRIKVTEKDGKSYYTNIQTLDFIRDFAVKVYPNPVTNRKFILQLNGNKAGQLMMNLYSTDGRVVFTDYINHAGGFASYNINLPASLAKGIYILKLSAADNTVYDIKNIVIE